MRGKSQLQWGKLRVLSRVVQGERERMGAFGRGKKTGGGAVGPRERERERDKLGKNAEEILIEGGGGLRNSAGESTSERGVDRLRGRGEKVREQREALLWGSPLERGDLRALKREIRVFG